MDNKDDESPDKDAAKEFYARYEPKEILGRLDNSYSSIHVDINLKTN